MSLNSELSGLWESYECYESTSSTPRRDTANLSRAIRAFSRNPAIPLLEEELSEDDTRSTLTIHTPRSAASPSLHDALIESRSQLTEEEAEFLHDLEREPAVSGEMVAEFFTFALDNDLSNLARYLSIKYSDELEDFRRREDAECAMDGDQPTLVRLQHLFRGESRGQNSPRKHLYKMPWAVLSERIKHLDMSGRVISNASATSSVVGELFVNILHRISTGESFETLLNHQSTCNKYSPLLGLRLKVILVLLCEMENLGRTYLAHYALNNPGAPLPLAYPSGSAGYTVPLGALAQCLRTEAPFLVNLGRGGCGKTRALCHLFPALSHQVAESGLEDDRGQEFHRGAELIPTTESFSVGFHIVDIHLDILEDTETVAELMCLLPAQSTVLLYHNVSFREEKVAWQRLASAFSNDKVIVVIRDKQKVTLVDRRAHKNTSCEENIFSLSNMAEGRSSNSEISAIRSRVFETINSIDRGDYGVLQTEYSLSRLQVRSSRPALVERVSVALENLRMDSDFKNTLFPATTTHARIEQLYSEKKKIGRAESQFRDEKVKRLEEKDVEIETLQLKLQNLTYEGDHVLKLFDQLIKGSAQSVVHFNDVLQAWQTRKVKPIHDKRLAMKQLCERLRSSLDDSQDVDRLAIEEKIREYSEKIDFFSVSIEHFWRECMLLHELGSDGPPQFADSQDAFYNSFLSYIESGQSWELIDGESSKLHLKSLHTVFSRYQRKFGNQKPFVISIIGPQSSGKSTLLNFLFGCNFQTSAGRCTRGMYGSLLQTDYPGAELTVILDTEGLLSVENKDPAFDKRIATLSMGLSQVLIINVNGELNEAMKKVISLSLFAAKQLKMSEGRRPILLFVCRNMIDDDMHKQRPLVDFMSEELRNAAAAAKVTIEEIVEYYEEDSFFLMYSAFNKDDLIDEQGNRLYSSCSVNDAFRVKSSGLLARLFEVAQRAELNRQPSLEEFLHRANNYWLSLRDYNDLLSFSSIKELNDRKELQSLCADIRKQHLESMTEDSLATKLANRTDFTHLQLDSFEVQYTEIVEKALIDATSNRDYSQDLMEEHVRNLRKQVTMMITNAKDDVVRVSAYGAIQRNVDAFQQQMNEDIEIKIRNNHLLLLNTSDEERLLAVQRMKHETRGYLERYKLELEKRLEGTRKTEEQFAGMAVKFLLQAVDTFNVSEQFAFLTQTHFQEVYNNFAEYQDHRIRDQQFIDFDQFNELVQKKDYGSALALLSAAIGYNDNYYYEKARSRKRIRRHNDAAVLNLVDEKYTSSDELLKFRRYIKSKEPKYTQLVTLESSQIMSSQSKSAPTLDDIKAEVERKLAIQGVAAFRVLEGKVRELTNPGRAAETAQSVTQMHAVMHAIHKCKTDCENEHLRQARLFWRPGVIDRLIAHSLFRLVVTAFRRYEREKLQKLKDDFSKELQHAISHFEQKMDARLGDRNLAGFWVHSMLQAIKSQIGARYWTDVKGNLLEKTGMTPEELVDKSNQILDYQQKAEVDVDKFITWCLDQPAYMETIFRSHFDKCVELVRNHARSLMCVELGMLISNVKARLQAAKQLSLTFLAFINQTGKFLRADEHNPSTENPILLEGDEQLSKLTHEWIVCVLRIDSDSLSQILQSLREVPSLAGRDFDMLAKEMHEFIKSMTDSRFDEETEIFKFDDTNGISDLGSFFDSLITTFEARSEQMRRKAEELLDSVEAKEGFKEFKRHALNSQLSSAIGCRDVCPYCGAKCENEGPHEKHETSSHRRMGLRGSHVTDADGEVTLIKYICVEEYILRHSKWKNTHATQLDDSSKKTRTIDARVKEMLTRHSCMTGTLNFTLAWNDPNDLDLHVFCPCGTHIHYSNRKCKICGGYLDLDMNAQWFPDKKNPNNPIEHVYFTDSAREGRYFFMVNPYRMGMKIGNKTGGTTSPFTVLVTSENGNILFQIKQVAGTARELRMHKYDFSVGIKFEEHLKKFFPSWKISESITDRTTFTSKCERALHDFAEEIKRATNLTQDLSGWGSSMEEDWVTEGHGNLDEELNRL